MSKYRRIEIGMWHDQKFRELSAPPPNGRDLWLYLLCGTRTTIFPGLVVATEAVVADDLRWPLDGGLFEQGPGPRSFREAWKEIGDRGMAVADWNAGVVMLPRALLDSRGTPRESAKPSSPNAFRGWARSWSDIPDCGLKNDYLMLLGSFAKALDQEARKARGKSDNSYLDAYTDAYATSLERVSNASPTRQGPIKDRTLTHARARALPVPVPVCVDLAVPDLGTAPSGASPPDLGGEPRVDRDPDRSGIRSRGSVVPPAPQDPAAALRRSLVNSFVERVNASRARLATELRIGGVRPIALMGEGERALMDRLKEAADPVADLDHVIKVSEAEARRTKELRWFGWSLAEPKAWRTRLAATLQEAKAGPRDQRRAEPPSMPVPELFAPEPEFEMTDEDRIARDELAARLARGNYETDQPEDTNE